MRVVFLSDSFSAKMGYSSNMLPKAIAKLGAECHLITSTLLPYQEVKSNKSLGDTYKDFSQIEIRKAGDETSMDGVKIHTVTHDMQLGFARLLNLEDKLQELKPDIVQCFNCAGWVPYDAARLKQNVGFKLFTECHMHASVHRMYGKKVHPLSPLRLRAIAVRANGKYVAKETELCYPIAKDCEEIAIEFYGVPKDKCQTVPLGVATEHFHSPNEKETHQASEVRKELGFAADETVVIYTGRLTEAKSPLLLAQAIAALNEKGLKFKGLFIGKGDQQQQIESHQGCSVHDFVPHTELASFYWSANLACWPAQESMSMLDAAACGLPIVVNDKIGEPERADGNGLLYQSGSLDSLVDKLSSLTDEDTRKTMGHIGAEKVVREYSWEGIARKRLVDYESSLSAS